MHFVVSRYLALLFAIGLGIGETIISWGHWQFAPLWIVDYLMVVLLLYAYYKTRKAEHVYTLLAAWAFTLGVFYMDLFVNLDPQLVPPMRPGPILLALIGFMLALSLVGFFSALFTVRAQQGAAGVETARRPGG
ncbi:MAG: hypothetical protein DLM73_17010 [Chthoniobacterales bacterium]|nr:MAG: hypothetical protein DLM73_17010 [Chthoniobacterales bacterium]